MPIELRVYLEGKVNLISFIGQVSDREFLEMMSLEQHFGIPLTPHIIIQTDHNTSIPSLATLTKIKPSTLKGWLFFLNTRQHRRIGNLIAASVARILNLNFRITSSYEEINQILYKVDRSISFGSLPTKMDELTLAGRIEHKIETQEHFQI